MRDRTNMNWFEASEDTLTLLRTTNNSQLSHNIGLQIDAIMSSSFSNMLLWIKGHVHTWAKSSSSSICSWVSSWLEAVLCTMSVSGQCRAPRDLSSPTGGQRVSATTHHHHHQCYSSPASNATSTCEHWSDTAQHIPRVCIRYGAAAQRSRLQI